MILKHVKVSDSTVGTFSIQGSLDNPYITMKTSTEDIEIGTYPPKLDLLTYQTMDNSKYLSVDTLLLLWDIMKAGHSSFKIDEGLYMDISPRGFTRFDRTTQSLIDNYFPFGNEIPQEDLDNIRAWNINHGYIDPSLTVEDDIVQLRIPVNGSITDPSTEYFSNVYNPTTSGGVDAIRISEEVLNLWRTLDNDRFMKVIPTNTNLGNHIIITQYKDLVGSDEFNYSLSYYKEIKVRVKFKKLTGSHYNNISTHNLLINNYSDTNMIFSFNNDRSIQLLATNVAQLDTDPVYVVKLTWDKSVIEDATIVDLVMFDNSLSV